ncbi:MAG TPA: ATP/GTP-binding protein [Trebonia sp.]
MSPRKTRRPRSGPPPAPLGPERIEEWQDDDWVVRPVPGAAAAKSYRCPGCDQEIIPGTAHMVAWPSRAAGIESRRHWHTACWQRRVQRRPGR